MGVSNPLRVGDSVTRWCHRTRRHLFSITDTNQTLSTVEKRAKRATHSTSTRASPGQWLRNISLSPPPSPSPPFLLSLLFCSLCLVSLLRLLLFFECVPHLLLVRGLPQANGCVRYHYLLLLLLLLFSCLSFFAICALSPSSAFFRSLSPSSSLYPSGMDFTSLIARVSDGYNSQQCSDQR